MSQLTERLTTTFTACYFEPKKWRFWRVLILCFCLCTLLGHGFEVPYCAIMDSLFDIVEDDYAAAIDPWFIPYWVYGFGALGMTFALEPLKEFIIRRRKTTWGAILQSFVMAVFIAAFLETLFGFVINQPDANGVYPCWDNSQLPLNILGQGWLVNDLFIGVAAMLYLWVIFPLTSSLFSHIGPKLANRVFVVLMLAFVGCCIATAVYNLA